MPDYAGCLNVNCELRLNCARYRMLPGEFRQSYAAFPGGTDCAGYWDVEQNPPPFRIRTLEQVQEDPAG